MKSVNINLNHHKSLPIAYNTIHCSLIPPLKTLNNVNLNDKLPKTASLHLFFIFNYDLTVITCPVLEPADNNTLITMGGVDVRSVAMVTCNQGYRLADDDIGVTECLLDGTWNATLSQCSGKRETTLNIVGIIR